MLAKRNNVTGESSQAITSFHFFGYFNMMDDIVADMEVDKVVDMVVEMVADMAID